MYKQLFETWYDPLKEAGCIDLLDGILYHLDILYENTNVYPRAENIFRAFRETPYLNTKAILLGQDPYHNLHKGNPNACGLSFITETGYCPPSLRNMFKELEDDIGKKYPSTYYTYNYKKWTKEVLMLNAYLTVEEGKPLSHAKFWEEWSKRLIAFIVNKRQDIVWILLGKKAQALVPYDCRKVEAPHPSPLSRGFIGSKVFSRTNSHVNIDW